MKSGETYDLKKRRAPTFVGLLKGQIGDINPKEARKEILEDNGSGD